MRYEIEITEAAESDLDRIHAFHRGKFLTRSMRICATSQLVKSGADYAFELLDSPAYRLRVGDYRVFYDVDEISGEAVVLRVLSKEDSLVYLVKLEPIR